MGLKGSKSQREKARDFGLRLAPRKLAPIET
jgi:hypothetical protein